jgi:hypothetical protein
MKFFVFNHKIIIPATPSIFPVTIEKMYDGPNTAGSQGTKTQAINRSAARNNNAVADGLPGCAAQYDSISSNAIRAGSAR